MRGKAPPTRPRARGEVSGIEYAGPLRSLQARWRMSSTLEMLLIVWGVLTALLLILLIYRSTLSMHEEEQLYLDEAESHMQKEQDEVHAKLDRIVKPIWVLGSASGFFLLLSAGMWIYEGLSRTQ